MPVDQGTIPEKEYLQKTDVRQSKRLSASIVELVWESLRRL